MKFTVSEDTEVILDGKKFLLEAGDQVELDEYVPSWKKEYTLNSWEDNLKPKEKQIINKIRNDKSDYYYNKFHHIVTTLDEAHELFPNTHDRIGLNRWLDDLLQEGLIMHGERNKAIRMCIDALYF